MADVPTPVLFLEGLGSAPLEASTAARIIESLLGIDDRPSYDAELLLDAAAHAVDVFAENDLPRALFIRSSVRAATELRRTLQVPVDLGYRREAVKLATKIFDSLVGRRVKGQGPLAAALLAAGARPMAGTQADILVVADGDDPAAAMLAFELHGTAPAAAYRFSSSDLDAACRRERIRLYPRDLSVRIRSAAASVAAASLAPPPEFLEPVLDEIRSGVRAKYADHGPSDALFAEFVARRIREAAANPDEARLLGEFLNEVIAARRSGRARR